MKNLKMFFCNNIVKRIFYLKESGLPLRKFEKFIKKMTVKSKKLLDL